MFGPYRLLDLIGRGGMGEVYRAFDTVRHRVVALKRLPSALAGDDVFQARFRRESELAARLREAHVVPIHDFGEIDGMLYIDMRLVDGVDLGRTLDAYGPFEPERAVGILTQVAQALDAAHEEGLVHRDVKPSNVLIGGDPDFAYLIDFGLVRAMRDSASGTSSAIGTLAYMAPERFLAPSEADPRVDVYALGCVLFEMLTGEQPFPDGEPAALMYAHLSRPVPRPSQRRPGVPAAFDDVVARAMAKEPAARFPRAGDLAGAARAALAEPVTVPPLPHPVAVPAGSYGLAHPFEPGRSGGLVHPSEPGRPGGLVHPSFPPPQVAAAGVAPGRGSVSARPARPRRHRIAIVLAAVLLVSGLTTGVVLWVRGPAVTLTTAGAVPVGRSPLGLGLAPDGRRAYVANALDDSVSVIDLERAAVVATLPVGRSPREVVVSPDGRSLYITAAGQDALMTVDAATGAVRSSIAVGDNPVGLAMAPDGRLYTADEFGDTVSVVDPVAAEVVATVPVGDAPIGVVVAPDGRRVYVTDKLDDTVTVVDTSTMRRTGTVLVGQPEIAALSDVPRGHQRVAFTADGGRAWFLVGGSRSIAVVDTRLGTVVDTIALADFPDALAFSADGSRAFVTSYKSSELAVIDIASEAVVGTVAVGTGPVRLAVARDGRQAYVVNRDEATVSVVDVPR
ncbi:protein kinase domain-containing protein [Pseudonocardia sp.]|uniref:protein kinase domain-containing protein n=1 Tax=Pseudonocardia sp. TaxID=60912 RepID=UPI003D0C630E